MYKWSEFAQLFLKKKYAKKSRAKMLLEKNLDALNIKKYIFVYCFLAKIIMAHRWSHEHFAGTPFYTFISMLLKIGDLFYDCCINFVAKYDESCFNKTKQLVHL